MTPADRNSGAKTSLADRLLNDDRLSASDVAAGLAGKDEAKAALQQLAAAIGRRTDPLFRARVLRLAEWIVEQHRLPPAFCRATLGGASPAALRQGAFAAVA